jgi:EAL domain-containing protein (putative c-di-GMP-specific phosphodiesterase class I)/AmiR/NasT family two-component response regulator
MNEAERDPISVLLVDDSAFARDMGARVLLSTGIVSVQHASSGQEALDLIARFGRAIDVVFCDLMMPDMDGIQMIRSVAALAVHPAFVFLSCGDAALLNAAEDTARARGLCVLGAIRKPLTPDEVRQVLARPRPGAGRRRQELAFAVTPQDLDLALERNEFLLHFQPKVSAADGGVEGFEALVRWESADHGMIFPDTFIGVAERCGRIGALTERVTTLALQQSAAWALAGLGTKVSINLSAFMLVDLDLPDRMEREAERVGINPRQIILEITESGLFQNTADTLDILTRLHMKGFPLSIDDFGTGYSSMDQLRHVPFAEMKIDRAFVRGVAETPKARIILESSARLGRGLKMRVVAEGVETQEDWDAVRAAGVDLVQGYFIAKPMAAAAIPRWMAEWAGTARAKPHPFQRTARSPPERSDDV